MQTIWGKVMDLQQTQLKCVVAMRLGTGVFVVVFFK